MEYDADIFDAVEFGDLESIKIFWSKETNIDWQDNNGINLIMLASRYNHKEIVKHLLTLKPNLYLRNHENETVFEIANKLEDRDIFKTLLQYCWKENEKIFIFEYHAIPRFESEFLGAYVNCWVMNDELNSAKSISKELIDQENWEIDSLEDISEIAKDEIKEGDERYKYYEQVIIDKEVLVFYTYDNLEE
ncbi:MAG: ankyrin repeat domain-containing protein [Trichodesmium erythraeum GBRTRLIN201]|nr:ankyrin repeat domain-containing protein [Trichodesmium erythraeum GBRTRLIN201]